MTGIHRWPSRTTNCIMIRPTRKWLPKPNFITLHYAYFLLTILLCAVILWGSARPFRSLNLTDAIFLSASAMTETGLNTVNLSTLNTFQQSVLLILIIIGSAIYVSAFIIFVRLNAFDKEFTAHVRKRFHQRNAVSHEVAMFDCSCNNNAVRRKHETTVSPHRTASARIGRNSQFHGLSISERQQLGGNEYKAVMFLSFLVPVYFIVWQLLGTISLGMWVANHRADITRQNGLNPWWVGVFNAVSAFNNSGMCLLDANMIAFQDSVFMLLSMGLFILAGNTAYPIFLRLTVWTLWKLLPKGEEWKEARKTLCFLLDHPRRCYTNMFPARHTWWLALALLTLNGIDWTAFEILNIGNPKITVLDPHIEFVDGLFQALAVRSGGFYVVPIPDIRISLRVLYVIMMYISVYNDGKDSQRNPPRIMRQLCSELLPHKVRSVLSGYGTVGISVGVPNEAYSFCGSWHALSKLVLVAVMIRGRHRGLPVAIDRAVSLPSVSLDEEEEEDARVRTGRADGKHDADVDAI